jgi:Na+/melibiose symporter-like transporter
LLLGGLLTEYLSWSWCLFVNVPIAVVAVAEPLLSLRVVLDRRRGGAYLAIALAGIGMFAVLLFLTYYLQQTLGISPLKTGVAFLPLVGGIVTSSANLVPRWLPRVGPRPLVVTGQLLAAVGLLLLWRLQVGSSYAGHVLPPRSSWAWGWA